MKDKIEIIAIIIFLGFMLHPVIAKAVPNANQPVYTIMVSTNGYKWNAYEPTNGQKMIFDHSVDCRKTVYALQRTEVARKFRLRFRCVAMHPRNTEILI